MAFRDWLKEYRESEDSKDTVSGHSPAASYTTSSGTSEKPTSGTAGSVVSGSSFRDALKKYREDQVKTVDGWAKISADFINDIRSRSGGWLDDNEYQSWNDRLNDLLSRADGWRKQYAGSADAISYIDTVAANLTQAKYYSDRSRKYYAQWGSKKDYDDYMAQQKDYEEKSKFDLEEGRKEIEELERRREERTRRQPATTYLTGYSAMVQSPYAAVQQDTDYDPEIAELDKLISEKKQYLNQAKRIQEGITLSSVTSNDDFQEYSGYVSSYTDNAWDKIWGKNYDATYEYINNQNGFRDEYKKDYLTYSRDNPWSDGESTFEEKGYDYLKDNEIAIYNYHYAKDGKEAAEKYLDSIQETLNHRKATGMYENMEDKTALEIAFGVAAGLDQFESGVKNLFNTEDDYIAQTAIQMASGMVRNDLKTVGFKLPKWMGGASLGQMAYDATTTMSNMAPSVLSSMAANILAPGSGAVVGNSLMFASTAGNAYQEALNLGYDKGQARAYSTLVGASEAGLQYLIGGISSMGGKVSGKALNSMLDGIDNAFLRTAGKLGGNMISEGFEEGLQEVMTSLFKEWALRSDEDINWSEVAYSALLGALTAGVMEGPGAITEGVNTYKTGERLQAGGISAQRLAEIGSTFAADTVAYQLAGRVDENTGAYTMGRLFNEIGATLTEQNVNEITQALVAKNMDETTAKRKAEVVAKIVEGATLSDEFADALNDDKLLAEAVRTTIIDSNATWFQRTKGYNEALMALAEEKTAPNTAEVAQPLPGQENAPDVDTVDTHAEAGSEAVPGGKTVSISSIQNGVATVKLEDGSEVSIRDLDLDPDEGVRIETIAGIEGISAEDANFILGALKATPGASAQMDSLGAKEAYKYGYYGFSQEHITKHGVFANSLSETQRQAIYETGRKARQTQVEKATPKKATVAKNATTGKVHFDGDRSALTERQSASLTAMEKVADALGVQIYVFESELKNGKRIGANGWYDPKDGSIHIDLHAGSRGEGTMLFTLAHELTHHIRQWSPAKFKALADFLMEEYGKKGVNVDGMVREQMAKAKRNGRTISYDTAYEEVVADSMETMLSDGNVMKRLEKLKAKDQDLWHKIKSFIDDLAAKIRNVYKGLKADSVEGRYVAEMGKAVYKLQEMFAEALVEASENYQSSEQIGLEIDADTESVSPAVMFSERTWTESDYVQERDKAAAEIAKAIGVSEKKAKAYIDSVNSIAKMIAEDRTRLDYFSSPGRSSFVGNVEYGGSFDFSTLCKKRRLLTGTFTAIQKALPNTALTADEILDIRNRMKEKGLEVSCGLCYVEGSRANMGQFAKEFLKLYKQYYPDAWQPNMADVNTPDGIEWVRINHPECYEQYEYFWNHYGTLKPGDKNLFASQQKPKLYQLHTEYKGEILQKFKDDDVEEKNLNGGIRLQSFSDFEIVHLIDTMQIIMDMSRVGLAGQAYTKVPDFAWALGDTGLKINLSLIAKGVDENGRLIFDDVEGMPIADAMKLRERYSKNVGTILVAFNDAQLLAAMADERVDFIIPFHRSQWKKSQYEAMGLPAKTKDYTYMQNEKFIKPQYHEYRGRMVKDKATNYMPNEYWDFSKSGKENAIAYLEMCARNNKRPKFYKLLQNNGDGSYSLKADGSTDGYWKLLIDFKMYDNEGNGSPQMAVKPEFNMDEANRMLESYQGGHSNFPVARGIVDEFVKEYKESHKDILYSDRDVNTMSNRAREILANAKPKMIGKNEKASVELDMVRELFNELNSDKDIQALADRVFDVAKEDVYGHYGYASYPGEPKSHLRLPMAFVGKDGIPSGVHGQFRKNTIWGDVIFSYEYFMDEDVTPQSKASTILHEVIHAVTCSYIENAYNWSRVRQGQWADPLDLTDFNGVDERIKAGIELIDVFAQVKYAPTESGKQLYGQLTAYEMVAEMANVDFRNFLKKQNLWNRIVDAIKRIFGIPRTTAYDAVSDALERILASTTNDADAWRAKSASATRYSDRDTMEQSIGDIRSEIADINDELMFAEGDEYRRLSNRLIKLNHELDKLTAQERKATRKTSLKTVLDNLGKYRRSDLESLAEQLSDGAWDGYEDLGRDELEQGIREIIEEREYSPIEMQSLKYGVYVRPVSSSDDIRYSDRDYAYETLTSKQDMMVTVADGVIPNNRADVVALAKKNAAKVGKVDPKTGSVSVHVDDIDTDVFLGTDGLKHGLRRTKNAQNDANYIVTVKAGEILKNSIKINEANPKKQTAAGAYVMIGVARNASGDMYIVRSIVNQFKNELASMDVLYAINAKKEPAALNAPRSAATPLSVTSSTISIAELLGHVNQYFPDILPEEVLKHYGYDARPEGDFGENVLYSDRDSNGKQLGEDQLEYFEKSEVRDSNGNLQVVYHGGTVQYEFDTSRGAGGNTEYGPGGYFTESEFIAKQYSWHRGGTVKEYYLNIERMFDDTDMTKTVQMPQWSKLEQILRNNGIDEKYIQQFRENGFGYMRRYLAIKAGDRRSDNWAGSEQMNAMLREAGFDGVKGPVNDSIQYVIFTPNQAKLTTNEVPSSFYDTRYSDRDHVAYDHTAILKESKVDEYLMDYAAKHSPKYAQAHIAYIRPEAFLKLTTDDWMERDHIAEQAGELDEEHLTNSRPGIYLRIDPETGRVIGHEGRHRMSAMAKADIFKVPVLIVDTTTNMTKTDIDEMVLRGQFNRFEIGIVRDAIPLNFENRDRIIKKFATQTSMQRIAERHGYNKTLRFSDRDTESVSNRSLLANAFEGVAQNDIEKRKIEEYKGKITLIEAEEKKLSELNAQIKELSFAKGPKDTKAIRDLQFEAKQTANRISTYDKQLLRLEASKPLQDVLTREKKLAYQKAEKKGKEALAAYREKATKTQRELMDRYQETRKRNAEGREKTAMRHKIQNVVKELNDLLLNESKKRHVPDSLKRAVADALALVNMDTVGAEERAAKYANLIAKETDPDKIAAYTMTMENILRQGEKMGQRLKELRDAYEEIQNSDDPDIANAYDPVIAGSLNELAQSIGNTSLRNMTIEQLSDVYDMYRMVLTRVRDANKTFLKGKSESISNLASRVVGEVRRVGGEHKYRAAILDPVRKFLWNNLKPVYAMEHIGSAALTEVFNGVRQGEDTWAKDVTEARAYYLEKSRKYGYDKWDFQKKYRFESDSGIEFELTLEQILSLYAYSKRDQAHDHLRLGGFVFDSNIETTKEKGKLKYKVNTADAHQITAEILADIIGKLSAEQKGFVDEMQAYLSTTMGAKGNEVTMQMYGVKLFKEKFYFPLKSAKQFMFEQNEVSGEVRIKNSGFTNKTVAKANNPVILSNFMEVWAGHVNDMSMYHAFVLPLEDFNRVFNYNSPKREGQPPVSVKGTIQSAYSPAAVSYVKNLITDLNGGARTDSTTGIINKMMGLFKKGSVFASLSVVVQQPSSIARAAALVDTKYFIGPKVDRKRHKLLWDEVKQYAPVAIIKEMGYFDTNMGKSTQDFILGKEYSGFKDKMKALVTDSGYRDEILSKAPALADEMAWCSIWEAVKREMHDKHKGLDVKSEPFLMLAGARFTEVITKTQVYDSVLSRSANMRSKDTGMKMATAFMAEPTTSINMIADALLKGKRGNRKYARAAIGAVIASQIFNSILVSFVYAGRDDDEDETYWEKYLGTLSGEILDSLNPATYIPFIKDIVSIVQGYDVERSDMAVVSDLWNAWQKLGSENLSVYRKVEGFAGSIAQIFGLPVKNIMRDVRGIYQTIESFMGGQQTTKAGIGYAVKESIPKWMGGGEVKNQQQLYEAILNGDKEHLDRVKARYKDETSVSTAIRNALRENDPRIREAALAQMNGDPSERVRIARLIIADGFSQDDVVRAINSEINALTADPESSGTKKEKGFYTAADFAKEIANGDQAAANAAKTDIIRTAEKNGKTAEDAEKSFNSSAKSELKELFLAGEISEEKTIEALTTYCGVDEGDAVADVQYWAFKQDYPDVYADDSWFDKYYEEVADSGICIEQYMAYRNQVKDITGEGKKDRRMAVIDSLPITDAQKDALYYAEGWAASKLYEAPWH